VKEKFMKRGFVIVEIPLKKEKKFCERLPDSQNSIVKRGRVCEKSSVKA
jgi:hypothetical protein